MDDTMNANTAAAIWARTAIIRLEDGSFHSAHLDDILDGKAVTELDLVLDAYAATIRELDDYSQIVMVALALPLAASKALVTDPPSISGTDLYSGEPPSLYLFSRKYFGHVPNQMEEYRIPISDVAVPVQRGHVHAFYATTRDALARESGWEYSRTVWLMHYP